MAGILSIQLQPVINDTDANLQKVAKFLEQNSDKKLDLVVLPEFFLTGISNEYCDNPADTIGGEGVAELSKLARKYNTNFVCGTIVIKDGDNLFNTAFALNRKGETIARYDKIHLFNYFGGDEGKKVTAGEKQVVVDFDFAKVGLSICFDIRYPMLHRKLVQMGAELIVSPTAWGYLNTSDAKEIEACTNVIECLALARAAENLVYFVTSDQCGSVNKFLSACGSSTINSPTGEVLANAGTEEGTIYADIDLEQVREFKKTYPVATMD